MSSHQMLRNRMTEFVRETYTYIKPVADFAKDSFWEASQVAYCLASVLHRVAVPLHANLAQPLNQAQQTSRMVRLGLMQM